MFVNKNVSSKNGRCAENPDKYKIKFRQLRKYMIGLVYENAALCDQVTYLQEKILHIKEENNFLARKLRHIEFTRNAAGGDKNPSEMLKKLKRKVPIYMKCEAVPSETPIKFKKASNKMFKKKQTPAASDESHSQLIFPISLSDDLTIQCLGDIVTDRVTYHTENLIYPVGYVSTKIYGSVHNPKSKCLYTCKIIDGGMFPRFEISSGEGLILTGVNPNECHQKLLSLINKNYVTKVINDSISCGADFFGLTNTTVHYLILSLPGVAKCVKYNFKKFSERISLKDDILVKDDIETCTNYSALQKVLSKSFTQDHFTTDAWLSSS